MKTNQAIFIIGSPGSGKDVVIRDISSKYNLVEFTSVQIDEMLSNDVAFKRAKMEKQDALLDGKSVIVTANSYDLNFISTKRVLESVGYEIHLVLVEANLDTSMKRLEGRQNLSECLMKIGLGSSNKGSILKEFSSNVIVDNSAQLDLSEQRDFTFSILHDFDFTVPDIEIEELVSSFRDKLFTKSISESIYSPEFDASPSMFTNSNDTPALVKRDTIKNVLNKTKKILFKQKVIPKNI